MNTKDDKDKEQILREVLEMLIDSAGTTSKQEIVSSKDILTEMEEKNKTKDNSFYLNITSKLSELYQNENIDGAKTKTYRHSYSTISRFIIERKNSFLSNNSDKRQIEEALWQVVSDKIEMIYSQAKDRKYEHLDRLFKLKDHISLEIARMSDSTKIQLDIEEQINNAKNSLKDFEQTSKNIQKDYIAILGVFAAIILAFVSGLVFSNSVLQNIDKASIYKLLLISVTIGFFITNILLFLFNFVKSITKSNESNGALDPHISYFNLVAIILILVLLVVSISHESIYKKYDSNSTINVNAANISFSSNR